MSRDISTIVEEKMFTSDTFVNEETKGYGNNVPSDCGDGCWPNVNLSTDE